MKRLLGLKENGFWRIHVTVSGIFYNFFDTFYQCLTAKITPLFSGDLEFFTKLSGSDLFRNEVDEMAVSGEKDENF